MNDTFINAAVGDKEDLDTKKERSLVPGHANVSLDQRGTCCSSAGVDGSQWDRGWTKELCPLGLAPDPIGFHGAGRHTKGFDALNTLLYAACVLIWELRDYVVRKPRRKKAALNLTGVLFPRRKVSLLSQLPKSFFWGELQMLSKGKCLSLAWNNSDGRVVLYFWHSYAIPQGQPRGSRGRTAAIMATTTVTTHFLLLRHGSGLEGRLQWESFFSNCATLLR